MTARELLRHCFPWEIRPGVAAPEEYLGFEAAPAEETAGTPAREVQAGEPASG